MWTQERLLYVGVASLQQIALELRRLRHDLHHIFNDGITPPDVGPLTEATAREKVATDNLATTIADIPPL